MAFKPGSSSHSSWLTVAIASGACAAFNGAFAKLTTTSLTSSWAHSINTHLSLSLDTRILEFIIRGGFFALNLIFNGVMWGLFTRALTLASSTVQVSIINTSANFIITAALGWAVFGERLPPLWWVGAAMLVAGSVIIGRRDQDKTENAGKEFGKGKNSETAETSISTGSEGSRSITSATKRRVR